MKLNKGHSTMKQMAYAKRVLGGQDESKKLAALNSGYSPYVSNSISSHIENKAGFHNAMSALAVESNNLAMSALHEFKARGFKDFSNKELINALNAIGSAWEKFNAPSRESNKESSNKLKNIVLQRIENQTFNAASNTIEGKTKTIPAEVCDVDDPMDF